MDRLDAAVDVLDRVAAATLHRGALKDLAHGVWLGHPLHPMLTDLPIGSWTSAAVLDLGGRRTALAADALVGLGVLSAVPTAVAGLADWSELDRPARRDGAVHAALNLSATALYAASFLTRRAGWRRTGVGLGFAGAAAASAGGYLGGHLTFRRGAGVNHAADAPADRTWRDLSVDGELSADAPTAATLDGAPLAVVDTDQGPNALFGRCSHLGGPLAEGDVVEGCVRCPWHQSEFRIADGAVALGPATAPQPAYEIDVGSGGMRARRRG